MAVKKKPVSDRTRYRRLLSDFKNLDKYSRVNHKFLSDLLEEKSHQLDGISEIILNWWKTGNPGRLIELARCLAADKEWEKGSPQEAE